MYVEIMTDTELIYGKKSHQKTEAVADAIFSPYFRIASAWPLPVR